jgi:hypothetical protein
MGCMLRWVRWMGGYGPGDWEVGWLGALILSGVVIYHGSGLVCLASNGL